MEQPSPDLLVRGVMEAQNLKVALVLLPGVAREARLRHRLKPVSASMLAQAIAGAGLLAALQKGDARINLQLECDGQLRGLLVDAGADGTFRGYVKNTLVDVELAQDFRWRAALGNSGYLSVLRDLGPEYYRSSVELSAFTLAEDLNHYFEVSDQVKTAVAISVASRGDERLGVVAGALVQALPNGDEKALEQVGATLQAALDAAVQDLSLGDAQALWQRVFPQVAVLERTPARWQCTCSKTKVLDTLAAVGRAEVQDILDTTGSTAVTCHFCSTRHEVTFHDLVALLARLDGVVRN